MTSEAARRTERSLEHPRIRWPNRFDPATAPVHVRNVIEIDGPAETVWSILIAAPLWPDWYANARDVVLDDGRATLTAAARFQWTTFGLRLSSVVDEFEPPCRIAWRADGFGVSAYHAWLITPRGRRSRVETEETQHGGLARLGALVAPRRMGLWHQRWLDGLALRASPAEGDPAARQRPP